MDARIVEFAEVLRQNGVRVSTSEVQDALRATAEVGLQDRSLFRAVLRTTLVKRELDVETFSRAFDFYFSGAARTFEAIDQSLAKQLEEEGYLEGDLLKMVIYQMNLLAPEMSPLAQAILAGDRARLAQIFRQASLQLDLGQLESPLQTGFFTRRLLAGAGMERARSDLKSMEDELHARGLSAEGIEIVSRHVAAAMRKIEDAARQEVKRQSEARIRRRTDSVTEKPLHLLTQAEVDEMEAAVRTMAEKLKSRLIRKQRSHRRGALNVRRTLRRNMPWDGIPMVPQFRSRRPERPELVVLCDVSDSVRNASRMMLLFMHTLQSLFVRVRSFVFVSDVGEVTHFFKDLDVSEAIDAATAGRTVSMSANSNYGRALADFTRDHLGSITRRTTVMIIGDGRNNYNASNAWALKDLRRKAKRLLWICPEDRGNWGIGDSEMLTYEKHCHQAVVVTSVSDLARIADQLVPA
ncbi:VWA domain-containing protein [Corallococcus praedator]|uniref:VWA domain-containing protein n=2 Tax=Corallococcus TaxID=83461 RepID=A0A3A8IE51_9BACT|nr:MULTISPECIES: VWA domain-containing protein [Corallococcus]MCY1041685.1 VWA domain-containing protein [Corallococcus sp. bb12-1]RKG75873.1 VWA domain-containing protein [Corallococcus terminator]RKG99123.1 VWA domain-containing protein [Corallococcus sp. CA047B]RKH18491.1 VWA domain-containing protein [Corallococcus sp. CA031C]RKH88655.1 VWA domain-containing protein [Corallococcus praedator]